MFRELLLVFALIWYKKSLSLPKFSMLSLSLGQQGSRRALGEKRLAFEKNHECWSF